MRRSWGYAFMAVSVVVGLLALAMPLPETVDFAEDLPKPAIPTPQKKAAPQRATKPVKAPPKPTPPKAEKPAPALPTKSTVSGRITRP